VIMKLVRQMEKHEKKHEPKKKIPVERWAKDFDAIIRIDKQDPDVISRLIDWVYQDTSDKPDWKGWSSVIGCPSKLRHHINNSKLIHKMNTASKRKQSTQIVVPDGKDWSNGIPGRN